MWIKPWALKEGSAIGAGLILMGLMLQLSIGPIEWNYLNWPLNILLLIVFICSITAIYLLRKRIYFFKFLFSLGSTLPILIYAVSLTLIMGVTVQKVNGNWLNNILAFWPFALIYVYLDLILGLVILKQIQRWVRYIKQKTDNRIEKFSFSLLYSTLFHIGLFITLTFATLGNSDMRRLEVYTSVGSPEWRGIDSKGNIKSLDFIIELKKFIMETYDDGTPRRFASEITIYSNDGASFDSTVDVNKPVEYKGWKIFQAGYDTELGPYGEISILEAIRDPWIGFVYCGIYIMITAAVLMFLFAGKKNAKAISNISTE